MLKEVKDFMARNSKYTQKIIPVDFLYLIWVTGLDVCVSITDTL